jgi:hypothetical protein
MLRYHEVIVVAQVDKCEIFHLFMAGCYPLNSAMRCCPTTTTSSPNSRLCTTLSLPSLPSTPPFARLAPTSSPFFSFLFSFFFSILLSNMLMWQEWVSINVQLVLCNVLHVDP